jgi:hypothetical protein
MSEPLRDFLASRLTFPGLAAWGAWFSPGQFASQSQYNWLNAARLQQTHQELTIAAESLAQHQLRPSRLCWVFEHMRIYFAAREDGTSLACYTQNAPGAPIAEIDKVLQDFVRHQNLNL